MGEVMSWWEAGEQIGTHDEVVGVRGVEEHEKEHTETQHIYVEWLIYLFFNQHVVHALTLGEAFFFRSVIAV